MLVGIPLRHNVYVVCVGRIKLNQKVNLKADGKVGLSIVGEGTGIPNSRDGGQFEQGPELAQPPTPHMKQPLAFKARRDLHGRQAL